MRALITGAHGFVGRHLVKHLLSEGDSVLGVSLGGTTLGSEFFADEAKLEERFADLTDTSVVRELIKEWVPDVVYHLAGISFVPACDDDFTRALSINVGVTDSILEALAERKGKTAVTSRFVLVSSGDAFGEYTRQDLPLTASTMLRPTNRYSVTKVCAETVVYFWGRRAPQIAAAVVRPFNHIGPGQDERFVTSKIAKGIAGAVLGISSSELTLGNLDALRDFTDVRDVARAYRLVADAGAKGCFLIGSGQLVPIGHIVERAIALSGAKITVAQDPQFLRQSEANRDLVPPQGDFGPIKALGWTPKFSLDESLRDLINYWKDRLANE